MSLQYALTENHLNAKKENYTAHTQDVKSHDIDRIVDEILSKGSTITRADILAVLNNFFEVAETITANGEMINTDLFKTSLSIAGTFVDAADHFDKHRHTIKVNVTPGKILRKALDNIHVEKSMSVESMPRILEVKDATTGSLNDHITSEGVVEIVGSELKIQGDNPQNGVSLVASDGTRHPVKTIVNNKPSQLFVVLDQLAVGTYTLEVTSQYNRTKEGRSTPRTGTFDKPLTVV